MSKASYRPAKKEDHLAIVEFQMAMARESEGLELDRAVCEQGVLALIEDSKMGRYLVCEVNQKVVGCLLIQYEWSDWRCRQVWWIHSVYLTPKARGMKLFSGFYEFVKSMMAQDPKVGGLRLYVDKRNKHAQRVYAKLGMENHHYDLYEWMKA